MAACLSIALYRLSYSHASAIHLSGCKEFSRNNIAFYDYLVRDMHWCICSGINSAYMGAVLLALVIFYGAGLHRRAEAV